MANKFDKNGYNSSDFKRNPQDFKSDARDEHEQDGEEGAKINEKAGEYMRELLSEKIKLNNEKFPVSARLIDQGNYISIIYHVGLKNILLGFLCYKICLLKGNSNVT